MLHTIDKEYKLLFQLSSSKTATSQRELAERSGLSIGLINSVLRKLIKDGYIRARALNKKKIHYLLTSRGTTEFLKRSYQKVQRTIATYHKMEDGISKLGKELIQANFEFCYILGEGELYHIVENHLKRNFYSELTLIHNIQDTSKNVAIINLTDKPFPHSQLKHFNLIDFLI